MKQLLLRTLLVAAFLGVACGVAHARSWRINNNAAKAPHFTDINAACASEEVLAGDTLYLDPGCNLTATQNVTKQLTIIGTGFFSAERPYTMATVSSMTLTAAETKLSGVCLTGNIVIGASHITLERCKANIINYSGNDAQSASIRQCYCQKIYGAGKSSAATQYWTIENCIVINTSSGENERAVSALLSPVIRNNYLRTSAGWMSTGAIDNIGSGNITGNIVMHTNGESNANRRNVLFTSVENCVVQGNVFSCAEGTYTAYPDNVCIDSYQESVVFALTGSDDHLYELSADSPAKAIEAGPFFGLYPYIFSGLPLGIPYFESSNTPTRPQNGMVRLTQKVVLQGE